MKHCFAVSGCATDVADPVAIEEPVISVHTSGEDVVGAEGIPLADESAAAQLPSVPLADRMVCVQAHRSSQTPPLIVRDIHRVP